jgi:death-on-curing protein
MITLNEQQVISLYKRMIDATGGTHGLRDGGLLASSLSNAFTTFDGRDLYPTIIEKAANICFCLIL